MTDEVLVHISTPATKQNDALYQSLAEAYVEFEPQSRYADESQRQRQEQNQAATPAPKSGSQPYVAADPLTDRSICTTSKNSYGSFPSHISLYDPMEGPNSSLPDDGSLEDSSVLTSSRLARLEHIHKSWKEKSTSKSSFVTGKRRSRQIPIDSEDADTAFIEDTQLAVQALQSQLQDTYSTTSEDDSEDDLELEDKNQEGQLPSIEDSQQDVGTRKIDLLAPARSTANAIPNEVEAKPHEDLRLDNTIESSSPSSQVRQNIQPLLDSRTASVDHLDFTKLPVNAFPRPPKISIAQPGSLPSQITKYLAAIKIQNPTRFKPSKKVRDPSPDDRGYWSVNCSHWPDKLQYEFWSSLCEHVLSGRLGWGSTLHRETSTQALGQIKLYCWGEVVEHMWLVSWLCSEGKMSGSRSSWYDADGVAVFEVP